MDSTTRYRAVSINTTSSRKTGRYRGFITVICGILVGSSIVVGIPVTTFYGLEYHKRYNFNEQPSYCRINSYDKQMILGFVRTGGGYEWNVDIVKGAKHIDVVRSNITSLAWYNPEVTYLIGGVYPCYVHKSLLSSDAPDRKANPRFAIQWEKPRKLTVMIWLCVGLVVIVSAIVSVLVAVLINRN